jgi:hypothetical protein
MQEEVVKLKENTSALAATNAALLSAKAEHATANQIKVADLEKDRAQLRTEKEALSKELTALKQQEPSRQAEYNKMVLGINQMREALEVDRAKDAAAKIAEEEERQRLERETWLRHETEVEEKMRLLCQQVGVEYIDKEKFPHSGKPDNCVLIAGEYIVFDSKSPQGEDLSNFPTYVKSQADAAKKYAKRDSVKKDIYLEVPTNAIHSIPETYLSFGEHHVHVITTDSLRTVLVALKKIEEYEFVDKLSPEDRDSLATFIGKLVHRVKRGIQIDCYLNNDLIAMLTDAENLPKDILDGAVKVERNLILNPTGQRRAKRIDIEDLKKDTKKLESKALGQELNLGTELAQIEAIPLYAVKTKN